MLLHLLLHFKCHSLPVLDAHLDDFESIPDEVVLHFTVHTGVGLERGSVIDFEHPRFELLVQNDVEAKKFKAAVWLLGLATAVDVLQLRLDSDDSLHDHRFNFGPDFLCTTMYSRLARSCRRLRHDASQAVSQL